MTMDNTVKIPAADAETINRVLDETKPLLLWLSNGQSMPTDMRKALEIAMQETRGKIAVYSVDTSKYPELGERFDVGKHPVLVAWHNDEVIKRRSRPWPTDVSGIAEILANRVKDPQKPNSEPTNKESVVADKPVKVTDQTFEDEVLNSDIPVLVDFWAEWCGPCKMVAPTLEKLAGEYAGQVKIAKVNVDENPGLAGGFRIMSIPTLMFVKEGKIVGQSAGAAPEPALRDAIQQLIELEVPA